MCTHIDRLWVNRFTSASRAILYYNIHKYAFLFSKYSRGTKEKSDDDIIIITKITLAVPCARRRWAVTSAAVARCDGGCGDRKIVRWGSGRPTRTPSPPPRQPPPQRQFVVVVDAAAEAAAVTAVRVRWCYLKPRAGNGKIRSYWYVYSFWQFFRWFTNVYFHGHSSSTAGKPSRSSHYY